MCPGEKSIPMIGRDGELELALSVIGKAINGAGQIITVSGEAGIGKSTFIRNIIEHAVRIGFNPMVGRCSPGLSDPLRPFTQIGVSFGPSGVTNPKGTFESVSFELLLQVQRMSADSPVLMVLEDIHWADTTTLSMIPFLARNLKTSRVCLILSYRSEEILRDVGQTKLMETLRQLMRENRVSEIALNPLTREEIGVICEYYLNGPLDILTTGTIGQESEGNPLFAMELIRLYSKSKLFTYRTNRWYLDSSSGLTSPDSINEIILRRLDWLTERQRNILKMASAIGLSFEPLIIADGLSLDVMTTNDELDQMESRFDLVHRNGKTFFFSHERMRSAILSITTSTERKKFNRLIAQYIEENFPINDYIGELAVHYCQAESHAECADYSLAAGERYLGLDSAPEASQFYQNAISSLLILEQGEEVIKKKRDAYEGLADASILDIRYEDAIDYYNTALSLSSEDEDRARIMRKCSEGISKKGFKKEDLEKADRLLDDAFGLDIESILEKAEICSMKAGIRYFLGDPRSAIEWSEKAEELFSRTSSKDKLAWEVENRAIFYQKIGDSVNARTQINRALEIITDSTSRFVQVLIFIQKGEIEIMEGFYESAIQYFDRASELAKALGNYEAICHCEYKKSIALESLGMIAEALGSSKLSYDYSLVSEHWYTGLISKGFLAHMLIANGELVEAEKLLMELTSVDEEQLAGITTIGQCLPLIISAELDCIKGRAELGIEKFDQAFEILRRSQLYQWHLGKFLQIAGYRMMQMEYHELATKYLEDSKRNFAEINNDYEVKVIEKVLEKDKQGGFFSRPGN